ncbi:hypothetical protein IKL64_06220 [bacterium]|nr:hypothetical protein [bacterium]
MITITPNLTTKNVSLNSNVKNNNITTRMSEDVSFTGGIKPQKSVNGFISTLSDTFNFFINKIVKSEKGLSEREVASIRGQLEMTENELQRLQERRLQLGRLLDYDKLRKDGFSGVEVSRFAQEDDFALVNAQRYINHDLELREHMFGYPANMTKDSAMTRYLRIRETELPLMNNCGDPYDAGNYLMDSKGYEQALLNKLFKHFGLDVEKGAKPWGYITTGGSESNKWGIHNGLRKFPNGRVYYSQSAHYSVGKSVKIGFDNSKNDITLIKHSEISLQPNSEKIDTDVLLSQIRQNWKSNQEPAILLLTSGTTKTGAVDDVEFISKTLKAENIPHYIHLDAALFGGIAKNQVNAPKAPNFEDLGIDSISVSLHKYFGNHDVKSVVITRETPNAPKVDYIGQYDSTTAGSRTFNPFSSLQRVSETLDRTMPQEYGKNVALFESMLKQFNIKYSRAENSNIFVIDEPSVRISQKYQLSDFDDNGEKKSHIIIFPYHKPEKMLELVSDLIQDVKARN